MSDEPVKEAAFFTTIRSWGLTRSDHRAFGGVLAGIGKRIGMAPAPARILFVIIAIVTGGIALLAYAAAWALLPDTEGHIIIQDFGRGRPNVGSLVAIGVLTFFGFAFMDHIGLGRNWGWWNGLNVWGPDSNAIGSRLLGLFALMIPVVVIGGLALLIVWIVRSSRNQRSTAGGYARLPDGTIPTPPDAPVANAPAPGAAPATAASATAASAPVAVAAAPPVPVYTAPPAPPRKPRVPGPGKLGYLLALAWIPITAAITIYLAANDKLAVFPGAAALVIYVAGLGVILMITALSGRKLGFLGFVSVVALIPVSVMIASADDIREHYSAGDWRDWVSAGIGPEPVPEETYTPPPAFDPSASFLDFETVAIDGSCYGVDDLATPDVQGTVRLSAVTADQTITVTSSTTRLVVPTGTSLRIVLEPSPDYGTTAQVGWPDRDVLCNINYNATTAVQVTNADTPVLTVRLDDAQQMGDMSLYIEEN